MSAEPYRIGEACRSCGGEMVFEDCTTPWCRQCAAYRQEMAGKLLGSGALDTFQAKAKKFFGEEIRP